jgi:hypothetical protein
MTNILINRKLGDVAIVLVSYPSWFQVQYQQIKIRPIILKQNLLVAIPKGKVTSMHVHTREDPALSYIN